jgi:hypothetical protein
VEVNSIKVLLFVEGLFGAKFYTRCHHANKEITLLFHNTV